MSATTESYLRTHAFLLASAALLALCFCLADAATAQSRPEVVGRIEGRNLTVVHPANAPREESRGTPVLFSGDGVTVHSGAARLQLEAGGEIDICGPAQFTVLKSGGSLTLALSGGRVHMRLSNAAAVSIYTAMTVASAIGVGDGPRDAVVGLDTDGSMCVLAARGAIRLEQQLTGQSIIVPESGEMSLPGGQLDALREARGTCRCDAELARVETPQTRTSQFAVPVTSGDGVANKEDAAKKEASKAPATEEPIWKVVMPPLAFDARKPPAAEPRQETILLVREVRVRPAVVFTGHVEANPPKHGKKKAEKKTVAAAKPAPPPSTTAPETSADKPNSARAVSPVNPAKAEVAAAPKKNESFGTKIRNFFRRIFGGKPRTENPKPERVDPSPQD